MKTITPEQYNAMLYAIKLAHERLKPTKKLNTREGFDQLLAWAALGGALHYLGEYPGCQGCADGTCAGTEIGR